jgi:hypothetical protein
VTLNIQLVCKNDDANNLEAGLGVKVDYLPLAASSVPKMTYILDTDTLKSSVPYLFNMTVYNRDLSKISLFSSESSIVNIEQLKGNANVTISVGLKHLSFGRLFVEAILTNK